MPGIRNKKFYVCYVRKLAVDRKEKKRKGTICFCTLKLLFVNFIEIAYECLFAQISSGASGVPENVLLTKP